MTKEKLAFNKKGSSAYSLQGNSDGTDVSEEITFATAFNNVYEKSCIFFEHPF